MTLVNEVVSDVPHCSDTLRVYEYLSQYQYFISNMMKLIRSPPLRYVWAKPVMPKEEHKQRHGPAQSRVRFLGREAGDTMGDRMKPGGREPCLRLACG